MHQHYTKKTKGQFAMASVCKVDGFPSIGTIEDPAFVCLNRKVYLSYQIAPAAGGGCALLQFDSVIDFQQSPLNVEGLGLNTSGPYMPRFAISPWTINEISGDEKTKYWKILEPRRWMISFMDWTVDIVFESVKLRQTNENIDMPDTMLSEFLASEAPT